MTDTIQKLKALSLSYRFYKFGQGFCTVYYPMIMICLILILSIMASTLFSLGYVTGVCYLMYSISSFLDIEKARKWVMPKLICIF